MKRLSGWRCTIPHSRDEQKSGKILAVIYNTEMDSPKGVSYTFSMSSTDAKYVDPDGGYVFQMPNTNLKNATRISLATLGLPLPQFPVEDAFSRVCFSEGIQLGPNSHTIVVAERSKSTQHTGTIELPLQNNDIWSVMIRRSRLFCDFCKVLQSQILDPLAPAHSKSHFLRSPYPPKLWCFPYHFAHIPGTFGVEIGP